MSSTRRGDLLLVGTSDSLVLRSLDGGLTWASVPVPGGEVLLLDPGQGPLYARTTAGMLASTDSGATWDSAPTAMESLPIISVTRVGQRLYAGLDGAGVVCSDDKGRTWGDLWHGISERWASGLVRAGEQLCTAEQWAFMDGRVVLRNCAVRQALVEVRRLDGRTARRVSVRISPGGTGVLPLKRLGLPGGVYVIRAPKGGCVRWVQWESARARLDP